MESVINKIKEKTSIHRTTQSLNIIDNTTSPPKHFNQPQLQRNTSIGDDIKNIKHYKGNGSIDNSADSKRRSLPASMFKENSSPLSLSSPSKVNNNNNIQQQQQPPHPQSLRVPLFSNDSPLYRLRESNRKSLSDVLQRIKVDPFTLVIDPKTMSHINLFVDITFLQNHGAKQVFKLEKGKLESKCQSIVYLIRPSFNYINIIIDQMKYQKMEGLRIDYTIIYLPKISLMCERMLEQEGCSITALEFPLDITPLDQDLLSLQLPNFYSDVALHHDMSPLGLVVRSLHKLQSIYGTIPNVKGKGKLSKLVYDALSRQRKDIPTRDIPPLSSEIDTLILIDRDVDFITPLITPLTYEGLIDDIYQINNNTVYLDENVIPPENNRLKQQQISKWTHGKRKDKDPYSLHSGDRIYKELRDINFSKLVGPGGVLNIVVKNLDDPRIDGSENLAAIRDIVRKVVASKVEENSLHIHISIAEKIQSITCDQYFSNILKNERKLFLNEDVSSVEDYLVDCIMRKEPLTRILKFLCLYSLTTGGIKEKMYESFRMRIVQVYGCEHLITINNLEKIGLLSQTSDISNRSSSTKSTFHWMSEELDLIVEDIDELDPKDVGFVHSGYAPLSIRLIEHALKKEGWKKFENLLKQLPGPTFEDQQLLQQQQQYNLNQQNGNVNQGKVLVYFIGGITKSEISALRFLSLPNQLNREFIIVSTNLLNSTAYHHDSIFSNLIE